MPNLVICDFFEEVPLVDMAIGISRGTDVNDLLEEIRDVPLSPSRGDGNNHESGRGSL